MHIHIISIFPEIFDNFINTSLIKKAKEKKILSFDFVNPRSFCPGKHQQVDDTIYGGGAGLLMKAQPAIEAVESIIKKCVRPVKGGGGAKAKSEGLKNSFQIILLSPSKDFFTQKQAHTLSNSDHLIFMCTRYEGIDYRFEHYMKKKYGKQFHKVSIGQYITLGGEIPAMVMIEAITRLIPGVIKEEASRQEESYSVKDDMKNLEYPQYTHPDDVLGMKVPKILLSGHHANIEKWKKDKTKKITSSKIEKNCFIFYSFDMDKTNFEDLEIWKMGNELVFDLGKIFYDKSFKIFDFQSQIMRAVMSITNNIAEGYERGSDKEFVHFLYYSKGSCGEVRSMLYSAQKFGYINEKQFIDFKYRCMTISTKIYNFIKYLKEKTKEKK